MYLESQLQALIQKIALLSHYMCHHCGKSRQQDERGIKVSILLPSGVGGGTWSIRVSEDGLHLILTVTWPKPLVNVRVLHKKCLDADKMTTYHPCITGFEESLKNMRKHMNENIVSTSRIGLPERAETHIYAQHNLRFKEYGTDILYVSLKSLCRLYGLGDNEDGFDEI